MTPMRNITPAAGPLAEMLARDAERADAPPLGGSGGEQAAPPPAEPAPSAPPPFVIPKPDWERGPNFTC
jgi:hypothetical protein